MSNKKRILTAVLGLTILISFGSCKKEHHCNEPASACDANCNMDPMKGWCGTPPAEFKYYFNATTGQCEQYIHVGDVIPFETLQECESCGCGDLN